MVPIYDTDQAEERWLKAKWDQYELWNKVEIRLRKQKRLWILATLFLFLILSSVPVLMNKWPKWVGLLAMRELAQLVNQMKREASLTHSAYMIRFDPIQTLQYQIFKKGSCQEVGPGQSVQSGHLLDELLLGSYVLLSPENGKALNIPGLKMSFCYDSLTGNEWTTRNEEIIGFGIMSAKDLTEGRQDRVSVLLISGPNGELSFD